MRVIYKKPGKYPSTIEIDNTLEALQEKVGGYIEGYTLSPKTCIICNEEGRLRGMPYNVTLGGIQFVGPILLVGFKGEDFCDVQDIGHLMDLITQSMTWGG